MSLKVRIYLDKKLNLDLDLILEKEDAHYLTNVMRLREGDNVFLFNSKDGEFKGEIISSDKKNTKVKLISKINGLQSNCPKRKRFKELFVQSVLYVKENVIKKKTYTK